MENTEKKLSVNYETHIFTTIRYSDPADNGFSGNVALFCEAVKQSDKVHDKDLKIMANGIFNSVVKHKIIKHTEEDIKKALQEIEDKKRDKETNEPQTEPSE